MATSDRLTKEYFRELPLPTKELATDTGLDIDTTLDQQGSSSEDEVEAVKRMCQVLNERRNNPALASTPARNLNEDESEEEYGIKAEALRRLKVRNLFKPSS